MNLRDEFEIAVRVREDGSETAWYKVRIPSSKVNAYHEYDGRYIPHDHNYGDPSRFFSNHSIRRLSKSTADKPHRRCAVIKNTIYTFSVDGIFMRSILSDFDQNKLQWKPVPSCPPNLFIRNTPSPMSLGGRIYIFGAMLSQDDQELGVIYDPVKDSWSSILYQNENTIIPNCNWTFVSSLGESVGKIIVAAPYVAEAESSDKGKSKAVHCFVYDVATGELNPFTHSELSLCLNNLPMNPAVVEQDSTVYWIDEHSGLLYALNWRTMDLVSGPIIGLEHESFTTAIHKNYSKLPLTHLKDGLFCLLWYQFGRSDFSSNLHCLITRVIRYASSGICMSVVGCFCATTPQFIELVDAYLLSRTSHNWTSRKGKYEARSKEGRKVAMSRPA
ncbi:uncharacterized protein LOC110720336 [Chenopodium quinoa]|uniref:uncharacterized protein LOC110720336 n=1 Tax=Chenopodium quinoa TaxID=63459 RepID=UPI000B777196|nr:uncharacterized protein LOC110720336 [Chenopodium quinoa]XP_021755040.1 uncharacterized protein LOC110720336 [Chenopodium quinoa]